MRERKFVRPRWSRLQAGFSLLELSVGLVATGLLSWAAFSGYETITAQQEIELARAQAQHLQSMVRVFALRQGRLPCPDAQADASGYETLVNGACASGNQVGWFPYVSVGVEMPESRLRARYSVFRAANSSPAMDADLAVRKERTGDAPDVASFENVSDLIVALHNAAALPLTTATTYLTGDAGRTGTIDCQTNPVMAVAYWVVLPLQDQDGNGQRLDLPHTTSSLCATSPFAPRSQFSDDVVQAESFIQLAGWLRKSLP